MQNIVPRPCPTEFLPKRRVELQAKVSDLIREARGRWEEHTTQLSDELRPELRQAVTLAVNLGDFGICGSNNFELLVDYDGMIERLVADIEAAQRHVHLLYYIFADDNTGRRVSEALGQAATRGVKCRVLMDGIGSRAALRTIAPAMRASGVEVHTLLPVGLFRRKTARIDMRNHRKIAVIDGWVMNEVKAELGGEILEILVENGEPVEFDQPLFRVKAE